MNFCGTKLREPTEKELEEIEGWQKKNPQLKDESDEDYIMRYCDEHMSKYVYYPDKQ